jgi:4-amino-4-deoxy-L-arabinose transferase-like glycosyltransferase
MPDDAFIHIGYAKDLSEGKGYSFAGNRTYGSTSPLWPAFIAALMVVHVHPECAARFLSFSFSVAAIFLMYSVARLRFSGVASLCAVCLLCFNAYFLRWSWTGMEATAACFCILLLLYVLFNEKRGQVKKFWYFIIGLTPLIRPEFFVFLPILFFYLLLTQPNSKYIVMLLYLSLPAIIWNSYALVHFGTVVPTTFFIKAGSGFFSTDWETITRSIKLFLSGNPIEFCVILAASVALILGYTHSSKKKDSQIFRSEFMVLTAWIVIFYLYYILKNVTILSRYSLVLLPPIILMTLNLCMKVCRQYKLSHRTTSLLLVGLTTISLLVHSLFTMFIIKPDADSFVRGFQVQYKKIASILFIEGHGQGSVALSDVGIIGSCSGLKICDFVGLVDKDRLRYSNNKSYFMNKKPQFLISRGELNIDEFKDTSVSFREIYSAPIAGFGINQKGNVTVTVYTVSWDQ